MPSMSSDEYRVNVPPGSAPAKPRGWAAPSADTAATIRAAVAENVRRERSAAGFTQQGHAHACAVAENTISRLEKPADEPRILTLVAVALALDVPLLNVLRDIPGLVTQE
jgi:DNA-binding XRE family transcriptional regulator